MLPDLFDPTETIGFRCHEARRTDDLSEDRALCHRLRRGATLIPSPRIRRFPEDCGRENVGGSWVPRDAGSSQPAGPGVDRYPG